MSCNSLNPTAKNSVADTSSADAKPILSNYILHIPSFGPQQLNMVQSLVPLFGSPPTESPSWSGFAHQYPDGRGLTPLTLRYASLQHDDLSVQQQAQNYVRSAVWVTVERLLAGHGLGREALPLITFDEGPRTPTGGFGTVDLTFNDRHAFSIVHDQLREIKIGENDQRGTYTLSAYTNSIDGTVFRVDIVNLPVTGDETELCPLHLALTHLASSIGLLLGVAKSVLNSPLHEAPVYAGVLRLFVKLDRSLMAVPLVSLATRLPTHMLWQGTRNALIYNGRYFHHGPSDSEDYHSQTSGGGSVNTNNNSSSSTQGAGTSTKPSVKAPQAPPKPGGAKAGATAAAAAGVRRARRGRRAAAKKTRESCSTALGQRRMSSSSSTFSPFRQEAAHKLRPLRPPCKAQSPPPLLLFPVPSYNASPDLLRSSASSLMSHCLPLLTASLWKGSSPLSLSGPTLSSTTSFAPSLFHRSVNPQTFAPTTASAVNVEQPESCVHEKESVAIPASEKCSRESGLTLDE